MKTLKMKQPSTEELCMVEGGGGLTTILACIGKLWLDGYRQPSAGEPGSECFATTIRSR